MKLSHLVLFLSADAGRGKQKLVRGFVSHQACLANDDIQSNVENGSVNCSGSTCSLKCNNHYHGYGGPGKVKCKQHTSSKDLSWTKKIGTCRTCQDTDISGIDTSIFKKRCTTNGKGIRVCTVTCKNKTTIEPIMKRRASLQCKCIWQRDRDGWCHWRLGARVVDNPNWTRFYHGEWTCGPDPRPKPSKNPLNVQTTTAVATLPTTSPHRIPKGLFCKDQGNRIVGGVEAFAHSWPWIVRVYFGTATGCGGTIIDDETIISAAHCCKGYMNRPDRVKPYVGEHRTNVHDLGEFVATVKRVIIHPDYRAGIFRNDICILKTEKMHLMARPTAAAACLPPKGWHPETNTRCWAAGWGRMEKYKPTTVLREVNLNIISDQRCMDTPNAGSFIENEMFCAGHLSGSEVGKDACQGDSGGPLICVLDEQPILTGITSWGLGCGRPNSPGVWTKVTNYTAWIRSFM